MSIPVIDDIKAEKAKQGLSLSDLAEASGVSEATLSKMLSGRADNPTLATVTDAAGALNLEVRAVPPDYTAVSDTSPELILTLVNRLSLEEHKIAAEKDRMIERLESGIQTRNRCIVVLFVLFTAVMVLLTVYLIFDLRNGDWGFIRYAEQTITSLLPGLSENRTSVL